SLVCGLKSMDVKETSFWAFLALLQIAVVVRAACGVLGHPEHVKTQITRSLCSIFRAARSLRRKTLSPSERIVEEEILQLRATLSWHLSSIYTVFNFGLLIVLQAQGPSPNAFLWNMLANFAWFALSSLAPSLLRQDLWYAVFMLSCLSFLCPWCSTFDQSLKMAPFCLLLARIPFVVLPSRMSLVVICNSLFALTAITRMVWEGGNLAPAEDGLPFAPGARVSLIMLECLECFLVVALAALLRIALKKNVEKAEVRRQSATQLDAMTSLLQLTCDAVVQLDSELRLMVHSPELAAMLLRDPQGASLAGMKFTDFMPAVDASHASEHLKDIRSSSTYGSERSKSAHAFQTRLVDSCSSKLRAEVFQVMYRQGSETYHLVGLRDFTDTKPLRRSFDMDASMDSLGASRSSMDQSRSPDPEKKGRMFLDCDLETMQVNSASAPLNRLSGSPLSDLFPHHIILLLRRLCDEGRTLVENHEPMSAKSYAFEDLPVHWRILSGTISGSMQLMQTKEGQIHVLMAFNSTPASGSMLGPMSPTWSPRSSQRSESSQESSKKRRERRNLGGSPARRVMETLANRATRSRL
ncbi:unnamed protein product, partial [Effrenium voratum]